MDKVNLREFAGGVVQKKFENSFERVMENLQDVNFPYKDKREITIKMVFEQNEARDDVMCDVFVKEKLASQAPVTTRFAVGKDLRTGNVISEEYNTQIRGQMEIGEVVDEKTGEITPVNFRKVK